MKKFSVVVSCALLVLPVLCAGQSVQPKTVRKFYGSPKTGALRGQAGRATCEKYYAELTIGELIAEDANRWSTKCPRTPWAGSSLR